MAVKVRYTNEKGLFHEGGEGVVLKSFPSHVASGSVKVIAANESLTVPGVYSVSGNRTLTLPEPTSCPGGLFVVQQTDGNATTINPAQGCTLISTFADAGLSTGATRASKCANSLASAGVANESCVLVSDGINWQLVAFRGTWTIS